MDIMYACSTFICIYVSFGESFCLPDKFRLLVVWEQARNTLFSIVLVFSCRKIKLFKSGWSLESLKIRQVVEENLYIF